MPAVFHESVLQIHSHACNKLAKILKKLLNMPINTQYHMQQQSSKYMQWLWRYEQF